MTQAHKVWLVFNEASGSNDEQALAELREAFAASPLELAGETCFPHEDPPTREALDRSGIETLATFSGDGTLSSVASALVGWSGSVLALPGGTMNMMARRMHGDATGPEIIARFGAGIVRRIRPSVVKTRHATGLTGALAGPGTVWADVREAMRDAKVLEVVSTATEAISRSAGGAKVVCREADCGREEGYSAISVTPNETGLAADGYYAEGALDFARHGVALLQRDFRNGPHDFLGEHQRMRLACLDGEPMGLLIDGESYEGASEEEFVLAASEIDFWTTADAR